MFNRILGPAVAVLVLVPGASLAEDLRDPTKPTQPRQPAESAQQATAPSQYSLDSILVSDSRRIAVINGVSLASNERVDGAIVKRIARDRVLLDINGKTRTLVLDPAPSIRR